MKFKRELMIICIFLCILFTISSISASDVEMNDTICGENQEIVQNTSDENVQVVQDIDDEGPEIMQDSGDESLIDSPQGDDVLGASTVYFDASAGSDGTGTKSNPYKTFKWSRISYGSTVYFANGEYTIDSTTSISSNTYLKFIGQSSTNTIIKSTFISTEITVNSGDFSLYLSNLKLDGFRIYSYGTIEADNVIFQNQQHSLSGSTIYVSGSDSTAVNLKLTNCQFKNNHDTNSLGGDIYATKSNVVMDNCLFYNSSAKTYGGAVYVINSNLNVTNSRFNHNSAGYGGAIYSKKSVIYLKQSLLTYNEANAYGGAVGLESSSIYITGCNFTDSHSLDDAGGAVYAVDTLLDVRSSRFKNGKALFGGAICNLKNDVDSTKVRFDLVGCYFTNNYATYCGGDIFDGYGLTNINGNDFGNSKADKSGGSIYCLLTKSLDLTNNNFRSSSAAVGRAITIELVMPHTDGQFRASGNKYEGSAFDLKSSPSICYYNDDPYCTIDTGNSVPVIDYTVNSATSLPSSYDSRDYDYVTPVKNQGKGGNCWAFAAIATLETCIKKATGITYDFSEENMKNLMARFSLYGINSDVNDGGYDYEVFSYLMSWLGPVYDELDRYEEFSLLSTNFESVLHVQNICILPENDRNAIKKAIMDYGAVSVGMPWTTGSHAITLVGWDDNYNSLDFFKKQATGAWIFKNSWGDDWYDHGYYYVGFDRIINSAYTFVFNDNVGYTDIYQYGFGGLREFTIEWNAHYKTKFTSRSNDILSAVSTYFVKETNYNLSVYKNGIKVTSQSGYSLPGYYTIPLNNEIQLKKGDEFEVEFQTDSTGTAVYRYRENSENFIWAYGNALTYGQGVSFYKGKNGNWVDFYGSNSIFHETSCIKAYTRPASLKSVTISMPNQFSQVKVNDIVGIELNVANVADGILTITVDGQKYYAKVENGKARLNMSFSNLGSHVFRAQYKSNREASNVISFSFDVVEKIVPKITITAPAVTKYYGGNEKFVATIYQDGTPLAGVEVAMRADGKWYYVNTNSNGEARLNPNLKAGSYYITVRYNSTYYYSKFTVKSTMSAEDANGTYLNTFMNASFLSRYGYALSSGQAIFKIGDMQFKATIKNGVACAKIDLDAGTYNVTVINPSTYEEMTVKLEIRKANPKISFTYTQSDNVVSVNAQLSVPLNVTGYIWLSGVKIVSVNYVNGAASAKFICPNSLNSSLSVCCYGGKNTYYNSKSIYITLEESNVELRAYDINRYYSSTNNKFYATIKNNGNPIVGQDITFKTPEHTYVCTTDSSGQAYITLSEIGEYSIAVSYGDFKKTCKVTIKSTIDASGATCQYRSTNLKARFTYSDGNPLKGKSVKFQIANKIYYRTTDSNGYATFNANITAGKYSVTIINPSTEEKKTVSLVISKATPTMELQFATVNYKDVVTAKLSQSDATGTVTFTFKGKNCSADIKDSVASVTLTAEGTYSVAVKYSGDANYKGLTKWISVTVVNKDPKIVCKDMVMTYLDSKQYSVRLLDYKGNALSSKTLKLEIGKAYGSIVSSFKKTTNSKGYAKFNFNKRPGEYYVDIYYGGKYMGYSWVTVKKAKSYFVASKKTFKAKTKVKKYTVSLEHRDYYLVGFKVKLKIAGKTFTAKTNSKGKATFKIKNLKKKKTYTAVIKFAGSSEYKKATKKVKIRVK